MDIPKPQLDRIDLTTSSRNTLATLIKLLAPHVPYSLRILGTVLNTGRRTNTLQDVDPSKVSLWSTIPLHSDTISTADTPTLFSIVTFSHVNHEFSVFCSAESSMSSGPPTEAEATHIMHVFEYLQDMVSKAHPTYDSVLTDRLTHHTDTDPPPIIISAVHPKWADLLAPVSTCQIPGVRYVFPHGAFAGDGLRTTVGGGEEPGFEVEVSEIQPSDLPFVHGASTTARTDAYLLSRAPYSVCLRVQEDAMMGVGRGRPVACALLHSDGSLGALRVDSKYQRRGLGKLVIRTLVEKLDFSLKNQGDLKLVSDVYQDLGGGALGWNWMDAGASNEVGNRFFTSMIGKEGLKWACQWIFIPIDTLG